MTARRLPPYQGLKGGPDAGPGWLALTGFAMVYVVLGALSLSTAFIQPNAAAVWIPSGYAAGLLIARGRAHWPAILMGSFVLNAAVNLIMPDRLASDLIAALAIAVGNSAEAVMVAAVADRFSDGKRFLGTARSIRNFLLLAVPSRLWSAPASALPPVIWPSFPPRTAICRCSGPGMWRMQPAS